MVQAQNLVELCDCGTYNKYENISAINILQFIRNECIKWPTQRPLWPQRQNIVSVLPVLYNMINDSIRHINYLTDQKMSLFHYHKLPHKHLQHFLSFLTNSNDQIPEDDADSIRVSACVCEFTVLSMFIQLIIQC